MFASYKHINPHLPKFENKDNDTTCSHEVPSRRRLKFSSLFIVANLFNASEDV